MTNQLRSLDVATDSRITRRDFLSAGTLGAASLGAASLGAGAFSLAGQTTAAGTRLSSSKGGQRSAILILNAGGPSHIDSWDMKPNAPVDIRGPFKPIPTTVPGIHVSELFPLHANIAHHLAFIRSCHHDAPATHEVGWQLIQTGRYFTGGLVSPHVGCTASYLTGRNIDGPGQVILPGPLKALPRRQATGQPAGYANVGQRPERSVVDPEAFSALSLTHESSAVLDRYGATRFGRSCLQARRLIEAGIRFVTINTFTDLLTEPSWDAHGTAPFIGIEGMRDFVAPMYDQAYSALIEDLCGRGLLEQTLVCSLSEFGRTPYMNASGGRDHWPQCWTVYMAGGGVQGGQVVGKSNSIGSEPADRPVEPPEIVASILHSLGVETTSSVPYPDGIQRPFLDTDHRPIMELFSA